jgi:restriction endonuclease S subunit
MNLSILVSELDTLLNAPNGISLLRTLILDLALSGKLSEERIDFEPKLLGDIAVIRTGKLDANASSADGAYPFFTCAKDPLRISTFSYDTECVLLAGNGNFDVNYYSGKFDAYQRTYILEAKNHEELFVPFLFRFMQSHARKLKEQSIGGVIKYLKIGFLTSAPISLPSLKEQKSIVAVIDSLMSMCDEIEENINRRESIRASARGSAIEAISNAPSPEELLIAWRRIQENWEMIASTTDSVESLRLLVLDLAIKGIFTSQTSQKTSLDAPIQKAPFSIPAHWKWCTLQEITEDLGQETPSADFSYIDVASINNKAGTITEDLNIVAAKNAPSRARKRVLQGSVLYSTVRPYLRNIAIVDRDFKPRAIASTAFAVLYPIKSVSPIFLFFCLRSNFFKSFVESKQKGVAYPAINGSDLKSALLPIPPLPEQEEIIKVVTSLMNICDQLESAILQKASISEKFTRSVVSAYA